MIYTADVRLVPKVNGLQKNSGDRARFDAARDLLHAALRKYPLPVPATVPVLLLATFWLKDGVAGDCLNYIGALEDSISVGKVAQHARKLATAMHPFPLLADDSLVRSFGPVPGEARMLYTGCGFDRVSFGVELL